MRGLRRIMRRDDGVAMMAVIGIMAVVTVIAVTAFVLSRQSMHESRITQVKTQAFEVANAGIDRALANMQARGFVLADYPMSGSIGTSGTADFMGNYTVELVQLANSEYLATSRGTSQDGAVETIKVKFFYMNLWEMNLAAGSSQSLTAGGGGITGTSNVTGPFYVLGNVEMGGTSFVHNGPFFVKEGSIILNGNAEIGEPTNPIRVYVTGTYPTTNFNAVSVSAAVPKIVLPTVDTAYMTEKWEKAKAESTDNQRGNATSTVNLEADLTGNPATYVTVQPPNNGWTRSKAPGASLNYKYIGPEAGPTLTEPLGQGVTGLTIGGTGSWGSWWGDGHYTITSHDDFAFDDATNTLYIEGTVFVDGPVTLAEDITYVGNGTIIANGAITVNGAIAPAGGFAAGNTNKQALGLVTPTNITINYGTNNTKDLTQEPDLAGAFFARDTIAFTSNGILFKGSIIAGRITFAHPNIHLVTNPLLPSFLPDAMPGRGQSVLVAGQWVRE